MSSRAWSWKAEAAEGTALDTALSRHLLSDPRRPPPSPALAKPTKKPEA